MFAFVKIISGYHFPRKNIIGSAIMANPREVYITVSRLISSTGEKDMPSELCNSVYLIVLSSHICPFPAAILFQRTGNPRTKETTVSSCKV